MDYKKIVEEFENNGCCKIENFLSPEEVEDMRQGMEYSVNNMTDEDYHIRSVYANPDSKITEDYFLNSSDKVSYFFESDAFDKEGNLIVDDRKKALNILAHALHWWNPYFKRISFGQKVKDLLRHLKYKDPVIVQSMLIFKHPKIGGIVDPHQDSSFIHTDPLSCLGLGFPIEDATPENGCLKYIPGSHKDGVYMRYVRCPGNNPLMAMKGSQPEFDENRYVTIPAKKGDCILLHGSVVHKSGRNNTTKSSLIYTYHVAEKDAEWSKDNPFHPTEKLPFLSVYSN